MPNNYDGLDLETLKRKIAEFLAGAKSEGTGVLTGLKDLATTNPVTTAKGMWEAQMKPFEQAGQEWATGSKVDAAIHAANGMVPLVGPWVNDIATEMADTGNYAKGMGRAVGGTAMGELTGKVGGAAKGLIPELPAGLSKAEFASALTKNPRLAHLLTDETGEVKLGKAAQDIADRRTQPFGRPPVGVTERRATELSARGGGEAIDTAPLNRKPANQAHIDELVAAQAATKGGTMPPRITPEPIPTGPMATPETSGQAFKQFFSDVTTGKEQYKPKAPWKAIVPLEEQAPFTAEYGKHTGNFDEHIAASIPGYRENQVRKGSAIAKVLGPTGGSVLDIGASEGSFGKTISALSGGKVRTVSLDPNPDMAQHFATKSQVPGAEYSTDAFHQGFMDEGKQVNAYNPKDRFDVVHEAMAFQFISPERGAQIAEAKRLMKPGGVFMTEQKVLNTPETWTANELKKDTQYKKNNFSPDQLAAKNKEVKFNQDPNETKQVGMVDNMVQQQALEDLLQQHFKHVVQVTDSGNFKGYAASDDPVKLQGIVEGMGDINHPYSTTKTPRTVDMSRYKDMTNDVPAIPIHPQMLDALTQKTNAGGTTFNLLNGDLKGKKMYAVGAYPDRTLKLKTAPTPEVHGEFIQKNMDLLKDPSNSFGSWFDPDAKEWVFDVVKTLPSKTEAINLGRKLGENAVYGLEKGDLIDLNTFKTMSSQGAFSGDRTTGHFKEGPGGLSSITPEEWSKLTSNPTPTKLRSLWDRLKSEKGQVTVDFEPFVKLLKLVKGEPTFNADVMRKMEAAIKAGEGSAGKWEPLSKHMAAFGGDELGPQTYARFWGATSPNTPVSRNNYESLQAWNSMLKGDIPFTKESAQRSDITMVGAKVPNLNRAIAGNPLQGGRKEIGKTEAMSRLVAGKEDTPTTPNIPIDVHALSGVGAGEPDVSSIYSDLRGFMKEKTGQSKLSYTDLYNIAANVYRKGLAKFGEDVFPTMWEGVKVLKGQGQSQGMTSWLKDKGLLEPGQMVNSKALEAVIRNIDRSEFYGKGPSAKRGTK